MNPTEYLLQPVGDSEFFYSASSREHECIGHMRGYFDDCDMLFTSWWPHATDALNTPEFKQEFNDLVNHLRKNVLSSLRALRSHIYAHPHPLDGDNWNSPHGYVIFTRKYDLYLRCTTQRGEYIYIYVYAHQ